MITSNVVVSSFELFSPVAFSTMSQALCHSKVHDVMHAVVIATFPMWPN